MILKLIKAFKRSKHRKKRKHLISEGVLNLGLTIDGHDLYTFDSMDHMPLFRAMSLRIAFNNAGLGVRIEDLRAFRELSRELVNNGDWEGLAALGNKLDLQIEMYASERILLEIGGVGILVDDEPLDKLTLKHREIKEKLLKKREVRAFFLNTGLGYLENYVEDFSALGVKEYLNSSERKMREATFLQSIGTNTYLNLWNDLLQK